MSTNQSEHADAFEVRPVTADDGDRLSALHENGPDTGDLGIEPRFEIDRTSRTRRLTAVRARPDAGNRIAVQFDSDGPLGDLFDTDGQQFETRTAIRGVETTDGETFVAPSI